MQNSNTTTYIKKLVKIVYEKERQIENMKRVLKDKNRGEDSENFGVDIHQDIRKEVQYTSTKMKQLNLNVLAMETKMLEVEKELEKEIQKNQQLLNENNTLQAKYEQATKLIAEQCQNLQEFEVTIRQLIKQKEKYQLQVADLNKMEIQKWEHVKNDEEKLKLNAIKVETELSEVKLELRKKVSELKSKTEDFDNLQRESQLISEQLVLKEEEIVGLKTQLNEVNQNYSSFFNDFSMLKLQVETLQDSINLKESQFGMLNETLKDYQQFAFQISQYIESAYNKHCCLGKLRSSKKLIKDVDSCKSRFEAAFCKMGQIQNWMDGTAQKLEKIIEQHELPNQTLENLSIIAHSFEEKLQLCDLTERIEKEKMEMDKNEQILLENLQKQIEKSELHERSKLVELDEIKQVLKVTKDINRELLTELNTKEYIISECRKMYSNAMGQKSTPQSRNLKVLLNIKQ